MEDTVQTRPARISSIDIIRGAVMILMAIDHVRVFSGIPAGGPTAGIFFTRWVTHFCAPAFIFLAGTSAYFYGQRHRDLSRYLLLRGIWLVVLELTLLRIAWTFNFDFAHYEMAGVIWVIGWSMILMAGMVKLPPAIVGVVGLIVVMGHNALDPSMPSILRSLGNDTGSALWKILYVGFFAGPISFGPGGPHLIVLYSLVPWVGVMAAGYAFGAILTRDTARRHRACLAIGLGAIVMFLGLRAFNLYGDPRPWGSSSGPSGGGLPPTLSFLNTTKYPASLCFLLMTLGPTIAFIPLLERARGAFVEWLTVFGRVPFIYYLLHIPLIHAMALGVSFISLGEVSDWLFTNHPMGNPPPPDGYMWGLGTLYLVWGIAIVMLYVVCRWFAGFKSRRTEWWIRYL